MRTTAESHSLTVTIHRNVDDAYEFLCKPENFSRWASGLGKLSKSGEDWVAETRDGPMRIRFSERNDFGVLDHWVSPMSEPTIYIPMRVIRNGEGCDLIFTLFRLPNMVEERFAADVEWVMRDLEAAKKVLEKDEA